MLEKAQQGTWPSCAPIGYLNISTGDKRGIGLDPERAGVVRRMFEWYAADNCSVDEVRARATAEGLTTKHGTPPSKSTIERILKNPFYTGTFVWKGKTYKGDHLPLISFDLFHRVQAALRKGNHPVRESKRSFAYTGLIKCAHCGCSITAGTHKGKYIYYRCTGACGRCNTRLIREDRLEALLGELVQRIHIDDETIEWVVAALKESHRDEKAYHDEQITRLQAEIKKLQDRTDIAYEDKLDGKISEEYWERKSRQWRSRQFELRRSVEQHEKASQVYFEEGTTLLKLAQRAYDLWLAQSQIEKRRLLDVLLLNCTFDGEKLVATYKRPFCWLAEGSLGLVWRG